MIGNDDENGFWFNSSDTVRGCSTDYVWTESRRCPADAHAHCAPATPHHAQCEGRGPHLGNVPGTTGGL